MVSIPRCRTAAADLVPRLERRYTRTGRAPTKAIQTLTRAHAIVEPMLSAAHREAEIMMTPDNYQDGQSVVRKFTMPRNGALLRGPADSKNRSIFTANGTETWFTLVSTRGAAPQSHHRTAPWRVEFFEREQASQERRRPLEGLRGGEGAKRVETTWVPPVAAVPGRFRLIRYRWCVDGLFPAARPRSRVACRPGSARRL